MFHQQQKVQCRACCQKECPDFLHAYLQGLKATRRCQNCHRDFFEILVTRPIAPKTIRENPRPALSTPFVFVDVDVRLVSNWKWGSKV